MLARIECEHRQASPIGELANCTTLISARRFFNVERVIRKQIYNRSLDVEKWSVYSIPPQLSDRCEGLCGACLDYFFEHVRSL